MDHATAAAATATHSTASTPPFAEVASAVRRMFVAAGTRVGVDCLDHALRTVALLESLGYPAEVKIGYAAWRVGRGDADVIVHAPVPGTIPQGPNAHSFHAWVVCAGQLVDVTTYQLGMKAKALDELDGGTTNVEWQPLHLVAQPSQVRSLQAVTQDDVGMFYYQQVPALQAAIMAHVKPLDPQDLNDLRVIYDNPGAQVLGPNHFAALQAA